MECFHQNIKNPRLDNHHFPYARQFLICFFTSFALNVKHDLKAT